MALTEANKLKLAQILGVDYITVNDQIFNLGTEYITAEVESLLLAEIDRWDAGAGNDFVVITATSTNYGANIDPSQERADIRRNVANLLYLTELTGRGGITLVRG